MESNELKIIINELIKLTMKMFRNKWFMPKALATVFVLTIGISSCGDDDADTTPSYRYIKVVMNGNSENEGSHLTEITLLNGSNAISVDAAKVSLTGFDSKTSSAPDLSIAEILFDGEGEDGGEIWAGISTSTVLEVDFGQAYKFTNVKLGVFKNSENTRNYLNVEVLISSDGSEYTSLGTKDVLASETF